MSVKRAVTFGMKHAHEPHPKLGDLAHPDGYIVVEAEDLRDLYLFLMIVVGKSDDGVVQYAFDYDLDEFEAPGGSAERHHPRGRTATFSALPEIHKMREVYP